MDQQKEFHLLLTYCFNQCVSHKDTTDFINFIERTKVKNRTFLVSMDVTSLYTNISQNQGIGTVCKAYDNFLLNSPPIPTHYLREMPRLILKENYFRLNGKHYLHIYGTAKATKMAGSYTNIFMAKIETEILNKTALKPTFGNASLTTSFPDGT